MSMFIRKKTPEQCRTHHQKIFTKYKSLDKIIIYFLEDLKKKAGEASMELIEKNLPFYIIYATKPLFKIELGNAYFSEW